MLTIRLALKSIINTITGMGEFSQVLILNDDGQKGPGIRYPRGRYGITGQGAGLLLEPMGYDSEIVLSPKVLAKLILENIINLDQEALLEHFSKASRAVSKEEISLALNNNNNYKIQSYTITEVIYGPENQSAIVLVDIDYSKIDGVTVKRENAPIKLNMQGEIWKVDFSEIQKLVDFG